MRFGYRFKWNEFPVYLQFFIFRKSKVGNIFVDSLRIKAHFGTASFRHRLLIGFLVCRFYLFIYFGCKYNKLFKQMLPIRRMHNSSQLFCFEKLCYEHLTVRIDCTMHLQSKPLNFIANRFQRIKFWVNFFLNYFPYLTK